MPGGPSAGGNPSVRANKIILQPGVAASKHADKDASKDGRVPFELRPYDVYATGCGGDNGNKAAHHRPLRHQIRSSVVAQCAD